MTRKPRVVGCQNIRIMTWNIGGGLSDIDACGEFIQACQDVDILTFTHTGHSPSGHVPVLEGFECVFCSVRSHDHVWGGVAVYARLSLHVVRIQDLPVYGMAWFCIKVQGAKDIYACVCYLPHGNSSYYNHEGGREESRLNLDGHFDILQSGVEKYRAKGEVIIMGDLNARTGTLDDRSGDEDLLMWEGMEGFGATMPTDLVAKQMASRMIKPRNSCDATINKNGDKLVKLCREQGMVIMNGRVPGDMVGACTYFMHGKKDKPRSLIDYFIATPAVAFEVSGAVREGTNLWIQKVEQNPTRPGGHNKFDHVPLILTVNWGGEKIKKRESKEEAGHPGLSGVAYKWNMEFREQYVDYILGDQEVEASFQAMYEVEGIDDIGASFSRGIEVAINKLHKKVGKIISSHREARVLGDKPCNTWYDEKCKLARQSYMRAVRQHGAMSAEAMELHREYRRVTSVAKRTWMEGRAQAMLHNLREHPKAFWADYGRSDKKGCLNDVKEWTGYFEQLFKANSNGVGSATTGLDDHIMRERMFPIPSDEKIHLASWLNGDFTVAEIRGALRKAATGKAVGTDGLPMEFIKYAFIEWEEEGKHIRHNVLADHVTHVFNMVLKNGYPKSWVTGVVVPVPKSKGSLDNMDDYRGITVGCALSKLYSMVMLQRLDKWAEEGGIRARGQAGFRTGRGTPDNVFVLNHVIEKYKVLKMPVYVAFIDFRKAYDCVDRSLLWESMVSLGVHGCFLESLRAMYEDVRIRVRVGGKLGECFHSEMGVKQGDPLSPLLFGIFIDRFEALLDNMLPEHGVHVKDILLKILLYADDLVLLAESPSDLQNMLDILKQFCELNKMVVNVKKSEIVIFNRQFIRGEKTPRIQYNGMDMEIKEMFIYLGVLFEEEGGIKKVAMRWFNKGRGALYSMIRRCNELDIHNVYIKCRLFDSLVRPLLSYGSEIWGPAILSKGSGFVDTGFQKTLEQLHRGFLRQCLGVRKTVPDVVLMTELRKEPLTFCLLKSSMRFWNKIMSRPDDDIVKVAMGESYDMSIGQHGGTCWAAQLAMCMAKCGVTMPDRGDRSVDVDDIMNTARERWLSKIDYRRCAHEGVDRGMSEVRAMDDGDSKGFKTLVYFKWFAAEDVDLKSTFWYNLNTPKQISIVARFRMGCHWLDVENGRISRPRVPRSQRICKCCTLRAREDELHVLHCPLYVGLRWTHSVFFKGDKIGTVGEDQMMKEDMNITSSSSDNARFWQNMASFLIKCKLERERHLGMLVQG